jgi:hypothetical protein
MKNMNIIQGKDFIQYYVNKCYSDAVWSELPSLSGAFSSGSLVWK